MSLILFLMISIPNQSTGNIAKRALASSERTRSARLQTSPKLSPCCDSDPGPLRRPPPATQSGRGCHGDCRRRAARRRIRIPGGLSRTRGLGAAPGPAPGSGPATVTLRLGRFIGLGPAVTVTRCRSAGESQAMPARLSESASAAAAARAAGGESLPVTRAASVHEPSLNVTVAAGRGLTESESRPGSLAPQRPARAATVTVTAGDRDRAVGPLSDHGSDCTSQ